MIFRSDNRAPDQIRPVNIIPDFISTAEGSVLIEMGNTRVICTASIEESVPVFLRNSGKGWISGEYGMLPRSTLTRTAREAAKGRLLLVATTDVASGEPVVWDLGAIAENGGSSAGSIRDGA